MKARERNAAPPRGGEPGAVDIIGRLRRRAREGTGAERRLAECILADPQFAASAPIADIAARARVSEPTVTRLARAMGFSGTRDIRFHLAQALAIGGAYIRGPERVPAAARAANCIAAVTTDAHAAIDRMMLGIREEQVTAIARRLADARQILLCGTGGGSSMAAVEFENRLFRLGLKVSARTDPQLQRMNASVLAEGDVIVGFSLSGQVRSVLDALLIARQYGAHTVAVTRPDTPIAEAAESLLPLTIKEHKDLYKPSPARYGLLAVVDTLALATARAVGPAVLEKLRRVRQNLASQNIVDPEMPIGD